MKQENETFLEQTIHVFKNNSQIFKLKIRFDTGHWDIPNNKAKK